MKKNWWIVAGLFAILVLIAGCTATVALGFWFAQSDDGFVRTYEETEFETLDDWPAADEFSEQFGLDWPASARDIKLSSDGFMDPLYEFRMTIDPEDLEKFAASPGCEGLQLQSESSNELGAITRERSWWTPEAAQVFQSCEMPGDQFVLGRSQQVMVDQSSDDQYLLYVAVFYI